jgi:uncharacterized protein YprB with RNaseH-like and TPR domain
MQNTVFFDIETAGLPAEEILRNAPEFKAAGNLKDPVKIKQSIEDKRQAYVEDAALSAITGRVLVIGVIVGGVFKALHEEKEKDLLELFWSMAADSKGLTTRMVGFNTHLFDLPFLVRRSWKLRVQIPSGIRCGRYWTDDQIDLRNVWQLGDRQAEGSLDAISRHFGVGEKNGSGKDFAALWRTDKAAALKYLENDLRLLEKVAATMGIE